MKFVIFHGAFGKATGNWFPELKYRLESLGQEVLSIQFPSESEKELVAKGPSTKIEKITLKSWLDVFEKEVFSKLKKGERLCFIGHSLGCVFILQAVSKFKVQLDSAIFVGPFLDCLPTEVWPYDKIIPDFVQDDYLLSDLKKLIPDSYVLYSDDDPYVANDQSRKFANDLESSSIKLHKAGHMNAEVDLDEFSLVLDLCLTRLDLDYAKKYRFLSQKIGAFEYLYSNNEPAKVTLDAQSTFKEKVFNFNDVKKIGFATQFTGFVDVYQPESEYMEYSRKAARRMKEFVRVILIEKIEDLKNSDWEKQIKLDIGSGIKVYLCMYSKVKNKIPEPDFGLWDNHHVVIGKFDWKTRKMIKIVADNSNKAVSQALKWQKIILENSIEINTPNQDLQVFAKLLASF